MSEGLQVADLDLDGLVAREWIVANGVGGYASSTVAGMNTRRYHGLLVAALAPPVRRMVLLSRLEETLIVDGREFYLACNEYPGTVWPRGHEHLRAFSTEPFPRWAFQHDGWTIEKQVRLLRGENTVLVSYTLWGGMTGADLELRPLLGLRGIHDLGHQWNGGRLQAEQRGRSHWRVPATHRTPEVFFAHDGAFERKPNWYHSNTYRREYERGYAATEDLWCPGIVHLRLVPGQTIYFACSADPFELPQVITRAGRQTAPAACADQPGLPPESRDPDLDALCKASGAYVLSNRQGESVGATAQYPWNNPSPRMALAAFTGLYLLPGRVADARSLLLSLIPRLADGLLPTELPEDGSEPIYRGADVSLWFVNAVHQYLAYTGDAPTVRRQLAEAVFGIVDAYQQGIERDGLSIQMDPDGLLAARGHDFGPTWMDAKVGDWVVTPRNGRAVEVNALWFNAVCVAADLARRFEPASDRGDRLSNLAHAIRHAFSRRFWNESLGCCYDVVQDAGTDPTVRPNQLLAVSLPYAVLAGDVVLSEERQTRLLETVRQHLLTPFGVRTLPPKHPDYQGRYAGNLLSRDRAYHNGSAFPWLLGPYVTALLRVRGPSDATREEARRALRPCLDRVRYEGLGQLCELFDGDAPHAPGGAIASPLSVGELLRCYVEDILGRDPAKAIPQMAGDARPQPVPPPPNVANPA